MLLPFSIVAYKLAIKIYAAAIWCFSFFNDKARLWVDGRNKKNYKPRSTNQKSIWIHVASLGEFEQAKPVIDELKILYPDKPIVITFFSPSGYEVVKRKNYGVEIYYLPIDSRKNAAFIIDFLKPDLVIFVKYEFWYFILHELKQRAIPVLLISAIFRKEQLFFKWYGQFFRNILSCFYHVFVQNDYSLQLLQNINYNNVTVSGDTRFDRVLKIAAQQASIPAIAAFKNGQKLLIAGSTWQQDEELWVHILSQHHALLKEYKLIIAPHEIHLSAIAKLQQQLPVKSILYSHITEGNAAEYQVLIIDNMGMLSKLYHYADLAYVGGGFGKGIHNILEAAVYSIPVAFGPNYKKFNEAESLIALHAAMPIHNEEEAFTFTQAFSQQQFNPAAVKNYFDKNAGATQKIMAFIQALLA